MTDSTDPATSPPPSDPNEPRRGRRRRRGLAFILMIVVAAGLTGALATSAISGAFRGGWGPHGGFMGGWMDSASVEDRADRMVRHLAIEIDATNEQQDKLRAIVKTALGELLPMREKMSAARRQARTLLTQAVIDRVAIETLRAEQIVLMDAASKRIAQAIGDAAEVLTPEQRKTIDDRLPPGGPWRGWRRG